jgi:hypothetical protein
MSATASDLALPQDLMAYVAQAHCVPVPDFYDRPSMVEPSYIYGYLPQDKEDSAVVWCKPEADERSDTYWLLFFTKDNHVSIGCPKKIVWDSYPGGLSIERGKRISLDDFYSVTDRKQKALKGLVTSGAVVVSYYDGIETAFYCYKNQWLFHQTD